MGIELTEDRIAFCGPWIGEFGWEIMTWVPYLRMLSHDYDKMYISTFEGIEALYSGFHCPVEFVPHGYPERVDDWMNTVVVHPPTPKDVTERIGVIKEYRVEGEYVRYGSPVVKDVGVLFHARGIEKGASKNWALEKWEKLAGHFPGAICIGAAQDVNVWRKLQDWTLRQDARSASLPQLIDLIASVAVVIGQSSGVMHLALMCGTPIVTWGDCNNFGDTLKNRYMETWNPFGTPVTWVGDTWDPEPEQVMEAIRPTVNIRPPEKVLRSIHDAVESGHYLVAVAYAKEAEGKMAIVSTCEAVEFPDVLLDKAYDDIGKTIKGAIAQAQSERTPASWV